MSPLHSFLVAGDRFDDVIATLAGGFAVAAPVAQAAQVPGLAPEMSITTAAVLVILTIGRMAFGHLKEREMNRHKEAVVKLEVDRIMAERNREHQRSDDRIAERAAGLPGTGEYDQQVS